MKYILTLFLFLSVNITSQTFDNFLFKNGKFDPGIPSPKEVLDIKVGNEPLRYDQVFDYFETLNKKSNRIKLVEEGATHEGRQLFYAVVSSQDNLERLSEIKENNGKLADPGKINSQNDVEELITKTPAIAFMMYSIHGDELSGTDASVELTYTLTAGQNSAIREMLNDMVIVIYPMENPDGRERILSDIEQWGGRIANSDQQSKPHSGMWPGGRTNHYFFDLNRDWFILSQPETKARFKAIKEWNPHLVVDAHEMGSNSSFLFNPPREPVNPNIQDRIIDWWRVFAKDQAEAFDEQGWSYYTREWLEEWYPGYGSSLPSYMGAVSILYEQAGAEGSKVKRRDGSILKFSEAVHHQYVSSLANLKTALDNQQQLLKDFYEMKKEAVQKKNPNYEKTYLIKQNENRSRVSGLLDKLLLMGVEVYQSEEDFELDDVKSYWGEGSLSEKFVKGSYIIPAGQPIQPLINAVMEFDTRMKTSFLKSERESIEKGEGTRLYEVSAWSLPIAYNVEAFVTKEEVEVSNTLIKDTPGMNGQLQNQNPRYGYIIKLEEDVVYKALYRLLRDGLKVRAAEKPFKIGDKEYEKGTLLLRRNENPDTLGQYLNTLAEKQNINITGVNTALAQTGTDLGGGNFELLYEPKTAVLIGPSISTGNFGYMWYLLDHELEMRFSKLEVNYFNRYDLRKYNILILPSNWGRSYSDLLGKKGIKKIKDWTKDGGTLIAIDGAAKFLADTSKGFSKVGLRKQHLKKLSEYEKEIEWEESLQSIEVDSLEVWGNESASLEERDTNSVNIAKLKKKDSYLRKFRPKGSILKLELNPDNWLCYGAGERVPAVFSGKNVYLSKRPVQTAARFANFEKLRVAGLLWKEAKQRLKNSAYLTRESLGKGQIILFADDPNFRSYFYGTQRLFLNSIFLGPGFGTDQPVEW